jgi:hypothetical protein
MGLEISSFLVTEIWSAFLNGETVGNSAVSARLNKIGAVTVQRGYMLRHGNSRLTTSDVVGWLQLTCAEAPLHMPR